MKLKDIPVRVVRRGVPLGADANRQASRDEERSQKSERMRQLHADPAFAAKNRERMKALHADPAFEQRRIAALRAAFAKRRAGLT